MKGEGQREGIMVLGEGDLHQRREIQSVIGHYFKSFFSEHFNIHTIYREIIQHCFHYICSVHAWLQLCFPSALFSELCARTEHPIPFSLAYIYSQMSFSQWPL